jgi:uncharacterized membrane protein YjjP (DUF1212 family)
MFLQTGDQGMKRLNNPDSKFFDVVMLAGKLMLMYGAETYRTEETMRRIANKAFPDSQVHTFVTPTGIFLTIADQDEQRTQMMRIIERGIDLHKVTEINQLSRSFSAGEIGCEELKNALLSLEKEKPLYPLRLQHLMAGIAAGSFSYLFGGDFSDLIPAFLAGILVNISLITALSVLRMKFVAELFSGFAAGLICILLYYGLGMGSNFNMIVIGSLMPLVPGVAITNSIHDLMAGDLVAGVAKGAEALLTALAVAAGVMIDLSLILVWFK